ncbi:UDP-N-acetylmuramate--L-alanine ligase [Acidithiobacillus sp. CV18-2]|uniref:UDP-N-acetylmuramate--L-alanine ligase n=1 Tax=Igneacidithiobacillus copahuensis TaxID=2724909 RepID=A0AAE3CJD6_9PROT|nr:UDP-N-acetylmuramate--L-alanine ligase [Igneacidithiobacillus copahuensis]MBU2755507.1 UDP-N-acetylmuramate--L-alanine ligase [Acidithiobacillus sp. CV18-3]MBU2757822.1 UDP-N-acetylmuramate--L-alanine ligase [Acidithiobacillus sp. BN09-2]MBU2777913.1 UDP-N-acetylmuramate--L-alanine ligase [Acidithiobacillus sp. CV18-2]MBU2797839.1 UDP-N-acetylmuramate--L-alanine ligase [Acidithiobacillus sp. VAN18-2]MBU2799315.1 UDP-N-acetylmuramate--L-alanine ligase [Acidithiobacillus sp. VAN18-4]UTV80627
MRNWVRQIHLVGIGGAGMRGIAEVLLNLGYAVSGSDLRPGPATLRLSDLGASIFSGHAAANVRGSDVVVVSSAIHDDNPEIVAAREQRIPVIRRAEMLAELMRFKQGIAIAGTHGKTTTTSLVASILGAAGLDPTFVIGGRLKSAGTHAALGSGEYLVAEADESDASFLYLSPVMAVVTNIDADHMETYGNTMGQLRAAFLQFLQRLPFYGLAVLCTDEPMVRGLLPELRTPVLGYGLAEDSDLQARNIRYRGLGSEVEIWRRVDGQAVHWFDLQLNIPGEHNVLNALAAIGIASKVGVSQEVIAEALAGFRGVARRFELLGDWQGYTIVDDYGHHPRELAATIAAARRIWPQRPLVLLFQPHRFTRTRDLFADFVEVLAQADRSILLDVYAAGEAPISGADSAGLVAALQQQGADAIHLPGALQQPAQIPLLLPENAVLLCMGAGNISQLAGAWDAIFGKGAQA